MLLWPLLLLRVCLPPEWILPRTRGSSAIHFSLSFSGARSCLDWLGFGARELGSWVAGEVERWRSAPDERHRPDSPRGLAKHQYTCPPAAAPLQCSTCCCCWWRRQQQVSVFLVPLFVCLTNLLTLIWAGNELGLWLKLGMNRGDPQREICSQVFGLTFLFCVDKHTRRMRNNLQNYCARPDLVNWRFSGCGRNAFCMISWQSRTTAIF